MAQPFKSLQPYEPRLVAIPYAAFPGICVDQTDITDCTDCTDCTYCIEPDDLVI